MFQQRSTVTDAEWQMVRHDGSWMVFDYLEWDVIAPIAVRYNCFPICASDNLWFTHEAKYFVCETTPQKAIAMNVINRVKETDRG
jgi:hypothetical protein